MGKTVDLSVGVHLSLASLAREFGSSRDTIQNRLAKAAVKPSGKRGGHPVYRLHEALPALADLAVSEASADFDPEKLGAFERHAHYKAEHERLRLQQEMAQLVPQLEVEQEMARMAKIIVQRLETLPDKLERDLGLSGPVIECIEREIDAARNDMYAAIVDDESAVPVLQRA